MDNNFKSFLFEEVFIHMLVNNEEYRTTVLPILKKDFFQKNSVEQIVVGHVIDMVVKGISVNYIQLWMEINESLEDQKKKDEIAQKFSFLEEYNDVIAKSIDVDKFVEKTEQYIQTKALHNAVFTAATILDENKEDRVQTLPTLFSDALNIRIDNNVGVNVAESVVERYWKRKNKEDQIPFLVRKLNFVTKDGFPRKTLNCFTLPTGGGKSAIMCSLAADYIKQGYNVLYITLELSEDMISTRIDVNITNTTLDEIDKIELQEYVRRCDVGYRGTGKIIVREFPTSVVNTSAITALINELKQKQNFIPDVLFVDYINLIQPVRKTDNKSYTIVKYTAEEIRGICVQNNMVGITATQVNRDGVKNNEIEVTDVSESFGLPATVDFMCGGFSTEAQRENNLVFMKVTKNRYSGHVNTKFMLKLDFSKMKLEDIPIEDEKQAERDGVVNGITAGTVRTRPMR